MLLTDVKCRNAKAELKSYRLADGGGLYLEVTPAGGKYWKMKYRFDGKEKKLTFGAYPLFSLAEARFKQNDAKRLLADGVDPGEVKKQAKRQRIVDRQNTFQLIAEEWQKFNEAKWSVNHRTTIRRRLELDIYPVIGDMCIKDLKTVDLVTLVRRIEKRSAHEVARRSLQYCSQVCRYAIVNGVLDRNPVADIRPRDILQTAKKGHFATIEYRELPEFLLKLDRNEARMFIRTRLAIDLMMHTFVRTSELIQAKWTEIDWENQQWVIPASRMKMKRDHLVPLSKQSLEILKALETAGYKRDYIFPSMTNPKKSMSNNTILTALGNLGYRGRMTGHGFRALAMSTIKEQLGYRHEVVDRQLAHAHGSQIDQAYDRAQFLGERRKMMQDWSDYLSNLRRKNAHLLCHHASDLPIDETSNENDIETSNAT